MKFSISPDILNNTTRCRSNFSCLDEKQACLCEIESSLDNNILFVKPRKPTGYLCNYIMSFGYSYICKCPTRNEIYFCYKK